MIRSFLNVFLPDDEYKRIQVLYFMAETTFLTVALLLLFGLIQYVFDATFVDTEFILLLGPFIMMAYTYIRYIFSGIEYTEVLNKLDYKKARHAAVKKALLFGVLFFIIQFIFKGSPTNYEEGIDLVVLPVIIAFVYFIVDLISLKHSIKKNKEIED